MLGSSNVQQSETKSTGSLFPTTSTTQQPLSGGLFGGSSLLTTSQATPGGNHVFGAPLSTGLNATKPSGGLFSTAATPQENSLGGLFGSRNLTTSQPTSTEGVFGSTLQTPSTVSGARPVGSSTGFGLLNTTGTSLLGSSGTGGLFSTPLEGSQTKANVGADSTLPATGSLTTSTLNTNLPSTGLFSKNALSAQNPSSDVLNSSAFPSLSGQSTAQKPPTSLFQPNTSSLTSTQLPGNTFFTNPSVSSAGVPPNSTAETRLSTASFPVSQTHSTTTTPSVAPSLGGSSLPSGLFSTTTAKPDQGESKPPLSAVLPSASLTQPVSSGLFSATSSHNASQPSSSFLSTTQPHNTSGMEGKDKGVTGLLGAATENKALAPQPSGFSLSVPSFTEKSNATPSSDQTATQKSSQPETQSTTQMSQPSVPFFSTASSTTPTVDSSGTPAALPGTQDAKGTRQEPGRATESTLPLNVTTPLFGKSLEDKNKPKDSTGGSQSAALPATKTVPPQKEQETHPPGRESSGVGGDGKSSQNKKESLNFMGETLEEYQYERIDGLLSQWDQRVKRQLADFQKYVKAVTTLDLDLCNSVATLEIVEKNQLAIEQKLCEIDSSMDQIESQQVSLSECLDKIRDVLVANMQDMESKHPLKGRLQAISTRLDDAETVLDQMTKDVNTVQESVNPGPLGDIITMLNLHQRTLDAMAEESQQLRDTLAQIGRYDSTLT